MQFKIEDIKCRLSQPLPGKQAHQPLSTVKRQEYSDLIEQGNDYRESAVALILFKKEEENHIILIQRSTYKGFHSNQISFPGGKKENFETDLSNTAIRESVEEVGLIKENFNLLGQLTPVYIPVSNFKVQPFVFYYSSHPIFHRQEREVSEIFTFPVFRLFSKDILKYTDITISNGFILKNVPYFDIKNRIVWGATALILNEFKESLITI